MRGFLLVLLLGARATAAEGGNRLDIAIHNYFDRNHIDAPAAVTDTVFVRRAYLDLWGVVPSPEQRSAFLRDRAKDKRERLIDALFENRRNYSEHWISFWNDLLRNDEGVNYIGERKSITPWLLKALEDGTPYNRMVVELLNPIWPEDPDGFLVGVNWRGDVNASQVPVMQAAQNSAQVFLGVNLKCNSCHDSFISKWKLKDAYGLASFFSEGALDVYRCDAKTGDRMAPKFLYPDLGGVDSDASLFQKREAAAHLFTAPENERFPRTFVNRIWKKLLGRGIVEPVDDMDAKPWDSAVLDALAADFVEHQYDIRFLLRRIMTSRAYQLPAAEPPKSGQPFVFRGPLTRRLTAEQFADSVSFITGEWQILPAKKGSGQYVRDWRVKSSPLTRALGRPIRDQVITDRNPEATTLQAIELEHGATLSERLNRGTRRMLGVLPPSPASIYDSGLLTNGKTEADVDITGAARLWLLMEDADSYDPARVVAGWLEAKLIGPDGEKPLPEAYKVSTGSRIVLDIAGKGYTKFHATPGIDPISKMSEINPRVRFFVFTAQPDPERLVPASGEPPFPFHPPAKDSLVERIYQHAFGRDPQAAEVKLARGFLFPPSPERLDDFLWMVFMSPEFQFIQ